MNAVVVGPRVSTVDFLGVNATMKEYEVNVTLVSHLPTPVEVYDVRVYMITDNGYRVKAERNIIGGISYT